MIARPPENKAAQMAAVAEAPAVDVLATTVVNLDTSQEIARCQGNRPTMTVDVFATTATNQAIYRVNVPRQEKSVQTQEAVTIAAAQVISAETVLRPRRWAATVVGAAAAAEDAAATIAASQVTCLEIARSPRSNKEARVAGNDDDEDESHDEGYYINRDILMFHARRNNTSNSNNNDEQYAAQEQGTK